MPKSDDLITFTATSSTWEDKSAAVYIKAAVTLLVRMGRFLTRPRYQPTNPVLGNEAVAAAAEEDLAEQKAEEKREGERS